MVLSLLGVTRIIIKISYDLSNIKSEVGPDGIITSSENDRKNTTNCFCEIDDGECLVCLSRIKVVTILGGTNSGRRNEGRRSSTQFSTCSIRSLNTRSYR